MSLPWTSNRPATLTRNQTKSPQNQDASAYKIRPPPSLRFIYKQWSLCFPVTTHHMLLEPWRALAQQKHNSEHGGTFNIEIPEIPPIKNKKNTGVFFHMIHSLLSKLLLWNDGDPCGAFVGNWVIKNYFKNKKAFSATAQLWIVYFKSGTLEFNRFSSVQQIPGVGGVPMFSWFCFSSFTKNFRLQGTCRKHFRDGWGRIFPHTVETLACEECLVARFHSFSQNICLPSSSYMKITGQNL